MQAATKDLFFGVLEVFISSAVSCSLPEEACV